MRRSSKGIRRICTEYGTLIRQNNLKGSILKLFSKASVAFTLFLTLLGGCSGNGPDKSTWLIVAGEDTITVGDVGEAWRRLGDDQRELFTSKDNTVGEYIVTFGRKVLLQDELEQAGYLTDDLLISSGNSWFNQKCSEAARKYLFNLELENVSEDDIDFFIEYLGTSVFYTSDPGSETEETLGPLQLSLLPAEIVYLFDSLGVGDTGLSRSGLELRLDSIVTADSAIIAQTLQDTVAIRRNAANAIANARFMESENQLTRSLENDMEIDSTALEQLTLYYAGESESPSPETVLLSSDLGNLTASDMMNEMLYYQNNYSIDPSEPGWLYMFVKFLNSNAYYKDLLERESPGTIDSLSLELEMYLLNSASDKFYSDRIQSLVEVTRADMQELFDNLEEPLTIPEKRVLQAVYMDSDSSAVYNRLTDEEKERFLLRMPGFIYLAADTTYPQITKPLLPNEVPGFHGDEVFMMDPADTTTWLGPLELYGESEVCMFRLVEVLPARNATFDEVEDRLRVMTRNKLEEQTTVRVMQELEDKYGMVINEDILDKLPEDPGAWAEL